MKQELGDDYRKHIVATTDKKMGILRQLADQDGYKTFFVPDDIGGRFSVFSAVGLVPFALLGLDIDQIMNGIKDMDLALKNTDIHQNVAAQSALIHYLMDTYKEKVQNLGIMSYVTFHGRKTKEEISELLSLSDIFIIPSNYESFCITGLEALACGLPVVSTKCYGPEEYLKKDLEKGTYKILSNYFASHQTSLTDAATFTVTIYTDRASATEKQQLLTLRLDKPKDKHLIGEVTLE
jgi:hypothetical protein